MTTPAGPAPVDPAPSRDEPARPRVLLVDDTRANLEVLLAALKARYKLGVATSGQKALDYVANTPPDLVLLDIMMPEMDGYEVCSRLKGDPVTRDIPIIFITALSEIDEKVKGFKLGAVDYITKPFEPVEVRARVHTHLQLESLRQDLARQNQALTSAYARLDIQHRELQGRDRLVRFQMGNDSSERACEEILTVACQVLRGESSAMHRPSPGGELLRLVATCASSGGECSVCEDGLPGAPEVSVADPSSVVARAHRERSPQCVAGACAAPLLCGDESLGVISVQAIPACEGQDAPLAEGLGRLAVEGAAVLQAARVTEDLAAGRLQADDLIALADDEDLA